MKTRTVGPILAGALGVSILAIGGITVLHAQGPVDCEPARWLGKAAAGTSDGPGMAVTGPHLAQGGAMMGRGPGMGRGHGPGMGMGRGGMHRGNVIRHRHVMMNGLPAAYASLKNPLPADAATIAAGRRLYEENCASCHGKSGRGDGEAGQDLDPKPADIAFVIDKPIATDGFLMWTISEGGAGLGTAMPAFKDTLTETQRWQIITWLRHGLGR